MITGVYHIKLAVEQLHILNIFRQQGKCTSRVAVTHSGFVMVSEKKNAIVEL